jgi:glyceraldehyde-3-phosphate dehydrogenase (NAD(P))
VHTDDTFGTHHARDVSDLFYTVTKNKLPIVSSAMKVNSQYMHAIRFSVETKEDLSLGDVIDRFEEDRFVSLTQHKTANKVFSFGRDHGFYGRIYNQAVVCEPSVTVFKTKAGLTKINGFMFTPQDGNSLLSSLFACLYGLDGESYENRLNISSLFLKGEI